MGRIRKNNEDNFYLNGFFMDEAKRDAGGVFTEKFSHMPMIFAVCDGMGGTARGEDASICAVRKLKEYSQKGSKINGTDEIGALLQRISDEIENQYRGSGTTIVMVIIQDNYARIVHVGDSRAYTLFSGAFNRATTDHSEVQRMYSMGLITKEEMDTHPKRHMINQFLGMPRDEAMVAPGFSDRIPLREGMRFMMCSDGLTDMVDDNTIGVILSSNPDAKDACKALVQTALNNGGKDNVTVMCLNVTNSASEADDTVVRYKGTKASSRMDVGKNVQFLKKVFMGGMILGGVGLLIGAAMILL
jgi:protein phosphatase